ncbi:rod shape-determining protein RodA [Eilatimonas milleporae]|uniref:Peptidoglycan glycosyltransferase MrdB n=1 Tax=Eilatimonas milleporae TaxID=911205 RepID=A0A3M0CQ79_9PROT|nr:rod shape-determining protein RodA [Eilatimonas milleporae]RMB11731.1 cell elongation-specific peptidoglycan biosynthesis regulator RodA [Eilatimonas milleporae]
MVATRIFGPRRIDKSAVQRLMGLNWLVILVVCVIAGIGFALLYSVSGGQWDPWASRQALRFLLMLLLMLGIAVTDFRVWMALAYPMWLLGLVLLVAVEFVGATGMGGQRWLDLGIMRLQPSELMKIAVVLALARYYHSRDEMQARQIFTMIPPVLMIILPVVLVIRQPDLGTGLMIVAGGAAVLFLAGVRARVFIVGVVAVMAAVPLVWRQLRDYQRERVLTFLNPESDPLGAGYQITQSKIAIGSGGWTGKGFLEGTQSQLNFLPEMKTDFIFTVLAEEFGLIGAFVLLLLYGVALTWALLMGLGCRSQFGRLLASGLAVSLFLYICINVAMVMGVVPVVGVPLPLVSYGGSAMLTWMVAFGLILCVATNRDVSLAPRGSGLA